MTARARLERDLLVKLALAAGHRCYRCGGELMRENFSVDHKLPWMSQSDPKQAFFDLEGVAFSHMRCNQREMIERKRVYPNRAARSRAAQKRTWDRMSPEEKVSSRREGT